MPDDNTLRDTADAITGIAKALPIYQDLAQPAVREVGVVAGRSVRALLGPIRGLVWSFERIEEALEDALAKRLAGVPDDERSSPDPTVAVPAIQALTYTAHHDNLREMYFNLLASAVNQRTAVEAHPAFVEIIKQLTPDEAKLLRLFASAKVIPLLDVNVDNRETSGGTRAALQMFGVAGFEAGCAVPNNLPEYITNLCRLGLTEIPAYSWLADEERYAPLLAHAVIRSWLTYLETQNHKWRVDRKACRLTPFGEQFIRTCVADRLSPASSGA